MTRKLSPARVSPPGRRLLHELEARGWTQQDLAKIIGRPPQAVSEIINAKKQITPETALELGEAFGTSADFWNRLETDYRLYLEQQKPRDSTIAKRSRLYNLVPVREMAKRGWLKKTDDVDALERELCTFLETGSLQEYESSDAAANFRGTNTETRKPETRAQTAWIMRVRKLVRQQRVGEFRRDRLDEALEDMLSCTYEPSAVREVPRLLKSYGIHFVIVPHLSKTYLDGAAFMFEGNPVIALTLRYDRLDNFWFVLMHEFAHIYRQHPDIFLDQIDAQDNSDVEEEANESARAWLLHEDAYSNFVERGFLGFEDEEILQFSKEVRRHAGIIVGRLQRDGYLSYSQKRHFLEKISRHFTEIIDRA